VFSCYSTYDAGSRHKFLHVILCIAFTDFVGYRIPLLSLVGYIMTCAVLSLSTTST
jgi:hypothetical protein